MVSHGESAVDDDAEVAGSVRHCDAAITLLSNTNRKPHKRFRLVPKSKTLDDLELTLNGHNAFFTLHMCLLEPTIDEKTCFMFL